MNFRKQKHRERVSDYVKLFLAKNETYEEVGFDELHSRAWWNNWFIDNPNTMPLPSQVKGCGIDDLSGYESL